MSVTVTSWLCGELPTGPGFNPAFALRPLREAPAAPHDPECKRKRVQRMDGYSARLDIKSTCWPLSLSQSLLNIWFGGNCLNMSRACTRWWTSSHRIYWHTEVGGETVCDVSCNFSITRHAGPQQNGRRQLFRWCFGHCQKIVVWGKSRMELIINIVIQDATVMPVLHYCLQHRTISNDQGFWVIAVTESVSQSVWMSLRAHKNMGAKLKQDTGAAAFPTRLLQPLTWFIYTKTT